MISLVKSCKIFIVIDRLQTNKRHLLDRLKRKATVKAQDRKVQMRGMGIVSRKNFLSFGVFLLLVVLLSGTSFVPAIYAGTTVQQQPNQIGVSQIIKQIAEEVAAANPGTKAASVEQVLTELA